MEMMHTEKREECGSASIGHAFRAARTLAYNSAEAWGTAVERQRSITEFDAHYFQFRTSHTKDWMVDAVVVCKKLSSTWEA